MINNLKHYVIAFGVGCASLGLESYTGSTAVSAYISSDGLTIIAALFAINAASLPAILGILKGIEMDGPGIGYFKKTRESAIRGLRETLIMGMILYLILASGLNDLCLNLGDYSPCKVVFMWLVGSVARACVFLTAYNTYDYAKALVSMSSVKAKKQ